MFAGEYTEAAIDTLAVERRKTLRSDGHSAHLRNSWCPATPTLFHCSATSVKVVFNFSVAAVAVPLRTARFLELNLVVVVVLVA